MPGLAHKNFPRHLRLKANADFQKVYGNPQKIIGRHFTMLVRPNNLGYSRIGLSISKKRVSNAVARNRLKRLVRESYRHTALTSLGLDVIMIANKNCDEASNKEIFDNLEKQWQKLSNYQLRA